VKSNFISIDYISTAAFLYVYSAVLETITNKMNSNQNQNHIAGK